MYAHPQNDEVVPSKPLADEKHQRPTFLYGWLSVCESHFTRLLSVATRRYVETQVHERCHNLVRLVQT